MNVIQGEFPFLKEKGHIIALVGAGGKTTLMYAFAECFAGNGLRTLVTTTTHIGQPEEKLWAKTPEEAKLLWEQGNYAVAGVQAEAGKMTGLPEQEWIAYTEMADIILVEADGAKRMPCKVPAVHEPVIPDICDIVIGVMGMDAFGRPLEEVCFRLSESVRLLQASPDRLLDVEMMARILASEKGTRKSVGEREYYVVLNKCDSGERVQAAEQIRRLLQRQGIDHCVLTKFCGKEADGWKRN